MEILYALGEKIDTYTGENYKKTRMILLYSTVIYHFS